MYIYIIYNTSIGNLECRVIDTVTDTASCGTVENVVSEIEIRHYLHVKRMIFSS